MTDLNAGRRVMAPLPETVSAWLAEFSAVNSSFAKDFQESPKACLEKLTGKTLPPKLEVVPCMNDSVTWNIPIPDYSVLGDGSLAEEQLMLASGGVATIGSIMAASIIASILVSAVALTVGGGLAVSLASLRRDA